MTALTGPTIRQRKPRQTPAERQAVYAYVTERDKTCRAWAIVGLLGERSDEPEERRKRKQNPELEACAVKPRTRDARKNEAY